MRGPKYKISVQCISQDKFQSFDSPYTLNIHQASFLNSLPISKSAEIGITPENKLVFDCQLESIIAETKLKDTFHDLKQIVFDDLTLNKGLYVTQALKFGAHFLVY